MRKFFNWTLRILFYILGLLILALGIVLSTKVNLGVSPINSISFCFSIITSISFADLTLYLYIVFVIVQVLIHIETKQFKSIPADILQIAVSFLLTRFINFFDMKIPEFNLSALSNFWGTIIGRIIILLVSVILTGFGASLNLSARLIPNPGDGIIQAISDTTRKNIGIIKNIFDFFCVIITFAAGLIFARKIIGLNIGTIIAMIGVGRVMWLFDKTLTEPIQKLIQINKTKEGE